MIRCLEKGVRTIYEYVMKICSDVIDALYAVSPV